MNTDESTIATELEVIGFNIASCAIAQRAGAQRVELCDNPGEGGTTASLGFIKAARELLQISLFPIIRPRGGDFLYTDAEFEIMKTDVLQCKKLGCDGVVIGMLLPDGSIDKNRCSALIAMAYPLEVTFHRAFDRCANPFEALEDIIEMGCQRILTSGQKPTAAEGAALLKELVQQANGRIAIMPGSSVRSDNILELAGATGAAQFHSSARTLQQSNMQFVNVGMQESLQQVSIDEVEVGRMAAILKTLKH